MQCTISVENKGIQNNNNNVIAIQVCHASMVGKMKRTCWKLQQIFNNIESGHVLIVLIIGLTNCDFRCIGIGRWDYISILGRTFIFLS